MARLAVALLCACLLVSSAFAEDKKQQDRVNPISNVAAGAAGVAAAPAITALTLGALDPVAAQVVTANTLLAGESAGKAKVAAGQLVGGLLTKSLSAHRSAGRLLVEIVNAINSLNIAGINLAAGVTNAGLTAIVGKIRREALFIGDIYTELLGEFGRFVGGSVNAVTTLKKGLFVSPLALKVGHLEKSLKDLITFLEAAVSPSVASPLTTAAWAPYLTVLKGVKTLLSTLADSFNGPLGVVSGAVDVATDAANDVLGFATGGIVNANGLNSLVQTALNLLGRIPGL